MLDSLPDFLSAYGYYLVGLAILCGIASYFSKTFFKNLKKFLVIFGVIFAVIAGYELITGNDIFSLPGRVDKKLSEQPKDVESGHTYYKKDRWGEAMPKND